jgi:ketosteroid isomerase-like protein
MEADDRDAVWAAVGAIYDGFLAGDRAAIDANIAADATIWDAFHVPLIRGKEELDAVRDGRPSDGLRPTGLRPDDPVIDVFGDIAVVRHILTVVTPGEPEQRAGNTSVWRRDGGGRWLCIHNHEDLLA